jgi:hypothetical protein
MKDIIDFLNDPLFLGLTVPIITTFIGYFIGKKIFFFNIEIKVRDDESIIEDAIIHFVSKKKVVIKTNEDGIAKMNFLKKGKYFIEVEKKGYDKTTEEINYYEGNKTIYLTKTNSIFMPFSLKAWSAWGNIKVIAKDENRISISGEAKTCGYVSEYVNKNIAGRILKISFENSKSSYFNNNRMVKLTYNKTDKCLKPNSHNLVFDEYLPTGDKTVEYKIPTDFDGKIGFVFYDVNLNNLEIVTWFK